MSSPSGARRLRLVSATTLVVASMLGTGVFTTSGTPKELSAPMENHRHQVDGIQIDF